ncbi:MAG: NUDIX domain-containing protein [Phycisphaerae bacterium]
MGAKASGRHQAAVIPFRIGAQDRIEVLLIRRKVRTKWSVPKGWIERGQTPREAAMCEAVEEAGALGELSPHPVGQFQHDKAGRKRDVQVFLLRVVQLQLQYAERRIREREWFALADAAVRARPDAVCDLIRRLPTLIRRGPRGQVAFVRTPPASADDPADAD